MLARHMVEFGKQDKKEIIKKILICIVVYLVLCWIHNCFFNNLSAEVSQLMPTIHYKPVKD